MKLIALTVLTAATGLAAANPVSSSGMAQYAAQDTNGHDGFPTTFTLDISGAQFFDGQGAAVNEILPVFLGEGISIAGIAWDVNLTTVGESWASEATMLLEGQINLTPSDIDGPVTNENYSSNGFIYFQDLGLPNILLAADGILDIEFYELFDDESGVADAFLEAGSTITFTTIYPAPGTLAMLGFGSLIATRRKR